MTIEEWSVEGYGRMRRRLERYCRFRGRALDEDVFHLTLLRMIEREREVGLRDNSRQGIDNYLFIAYKINEIRERQYPRNSRTELSADLAAKYDRADDDDEDIYAAACERFGNSLVDKVLDGVEVSEDELRELTAFIKEYV